MLFFALCVPLWMRSRWLGAAATIWTLLAICLPLLYLGYHWPSDIFAGAVVGVALMLLLCRPVGATGLPDRCCASVQRNSPCSTPLRGWSPLRLQYGLMPSRLSFPTQHVLQESSSFEHRQQRNCHHSKL